MMACVLLLEITRLLRQPPTKLLSHDAASASSYQSYSHQPHPPSRKISNISNFSTDSETVISSPYLSSPVEPRGAAAVRRMSSEYQLRPNLTAGIDELPKFMSVEHPFPPPSDSSHSRKVSVYLRINSRYGRQAHNVGGSSFRKAPPSSPSYTGDSTSDSQRGQGPQASPKQTPRRMSLSSAAFHRLGGGAGGVASHDVGGAGPNRNLGINVPGSRPNQHRKSFSITPSRETNPFPALAKKKDSTSSHTQRSAPTIQPSPPSIRRTASRRRPSVISRFLQRGRHAFRRPRIDSNKKRSSTTTQASSVNSSPSFAHRRMGSYSHARQDSSSYFQKVEDLRTNFPWLDTVEHLIIYYHKSSEGQKGRHRQNCHDLISALNHIYSIQFNDAEETTPAAPSNHSATSGRVNAKLFRPPSHVSISTVFSDVNTLSRHRTFPTNVSPSDALVMETLKLVPGAAMGGRAAAKISQPGAGTNKNFSQRLAKLDFSGLRLRFLLESGKIWGSQPDDSSNNNDNPPPADKNNKNNNNNDFDVVQDDIKGLTLDWLMEVDSAASLEQLMSDYNQQRIEYCNNTLSGLLHAPFSLMTFAGPVLDASVFRDLRPVAWDALLDVDDPYANSAGKDTISLPLLLFFTCFLFFSAASFFLLSCIKEKEDISSVFIKNSKVTDLNSMRGTIKR